ncbi:nuclear transport factor 2 family protein [Bradyrhizobium sp. B120]|uniref:nuclear transport factor 2 family protein n=1 Tax=Bradyrhizobium sp. B120 TaxID=3410088 RepID=UPI003B9820BA
MANVSLNKSTTDRSNAETAELSGVIVDVRTGERSAIASWVEAFTYVWDNPNERLERLLGLLSDDVVLKAPIKPPMSRGKVAARKGFESALRGMPDLRADIHHWSASGNTLFIELTFRATIGGHQVSWHDVDRITFRAGEAVERVAFFDPSVIRGAFFRNFAAFRQFRRMRKPRQRGAS